MGKTQYVVLAATAAIALFVAGRWSAERHAAASAGATAAGRHILYYQDPMHPAYRSDKPGIAPDCGMQLEPVYADGGSALPPGAIQVSPEKQQLIGVRTGTARTMSVSSTMRLLGRVAFDETQVYRVTTATDGWIQTIGPVTAGAIVKKNELLATFYNREFLTIQQNYIYALKTRDRLEKLGSAGNAEQLELTNAQIRSAEENLESLGMCELQIEAIAKVRKPARQIEVRAPAEGLVITRNVFPGLRFDRGAELYRIADLGRVWIFADLFENEARLIRPLQKVRVIYQGRTFPAVRSDVLPQFDSASRTMKVRLEMDNAGLLFRPDMFVDVEVPVTSPKAVTVPADAVIDSGLRKTVYVDRGEGTFEPRDVDLAWTLGDHAGIARGLADGERIVVAGNFLIDSESRMRQAQQPAAAVKKGAVKDPVCGMDVDPAAAPTSEYRGKAYYFCSGQCKRDFDKDPARYAGKTAGSGA